jgi:transketolase
MAIADERIVVLDGDLADSDGACHFAHRHPERFLMAGIAEQSMVSVAAGMAATGLLPCVFSFAAFLCYRAYDQIRVCVSQAQQPVILLGSHAGGLAGRNGKTHAAPNDLALMLSLPGMRVWAPADFQDVQWAIANSLDHPGPSYIRMPRRQFPDGMNLAGPADALRWLRPRRAVTVVAAGLASHWALEVANRLASQGLEVGVLHCACLAPQHRLAEELEGVDRLVTIEDHMLFGGLGAIVAEQCPSIPLMKFGWSTDFAGKSGLDNDIRAQFGLSSGRVSERILSELKGFTS